MYENFKNKVLNNCKMKKKEKKVGKTEHSKIYKRRKGKNKTIIKIHIKGKMLKNT